MRISLILLVTVASACSSGSTGGVGGGSGGSGGGAAGGSGGSGGGAAEVPMTCTPAGFTTAPSLVNHLPMPGFASAREHQAYANFVTKDGGSSVALSLTIEDMANDGGPGVPAAATVRFNGCDLATQMSVPGVGKTFTSASPAVWQVTVSRFVTFEVVSAQGVLLYRDVLAMPAVLPKITSVTTPAGPTAKVDWTSIPDAGVNEAYVFGWKRLGGGGLQSVGFANVNPSSGTVNLAVSQAAQLFQLEVKVSSSFVASIRLSSEFDAP